jgi:hypothetical protein
MDRPSRKASHSSSSRWRLLAAILAVVCWPGTALSTGSLPDAPERTLLLLDLRVDGVVRAESLSALGAETGSYYLDFAHFLQAVDFPIRRSGRLWEGWFRGESRTFRWHMDARELERNAATETAPGPEAWFIEDGHVYVALEVVERWFDVTLEIDRAGQWLTLTCPEGLPFQKWEEQKLAKYRLRPAEREASSVFVSDQYRWVTVPTFNLSSHVTTSASDSAESRSATLSMLNSFDLLKHSVLYSGSFASGTNQGRSHSHRMTVERAAPTADGTLFMGANRYAFGDVMPSHSNLVLDSTSGRGFILERHPAGYASGMNAATIAGDAPVGWEVELYRNGILLDFATVNVDGRYVFEDQETVLGENVFVARLYGPQGQVAEQAHTVWGGGVELESGDYDFSVSHIDYDHRLLEGIDFDAERLPAKYATDVRATRALTPDLQIGAAFTRAGVGNRDRDGSFTDEDYLALNGRVRLARGVLIGEVVDQLDAGRAVSLEYLTGRWGQSLSLARRSYRDFTSPVSVRRQDVRHENEVSLSSPLQRFGLTGYSLRFRHSRLSEGSNEYRIQHRVGARVGPLSLRNDLDHVIAGGSGATSGQFKAAGRFRSFSFRGQADYHLGFAEALRQVSGTLGWDISQRTYASMSVAQVLAGEGGTQFSGLFSARFGDLDLSFNVSTDLEKRWKVGLGLNFSFGYDRHSRSLVTSDRSLAHSGRAALKLFVDENNNGIRDQDEQPVQWASYRDAETISSAPGTLPLRAMPRYQPVRIETRHLKFDDPFLIPREGGYEIYTHAGSELSVDVAVVPTGDIEGYVFASSEDAGVSRAARDLPVSLRSPSGKIVATARTEFDGFYCFTGVPPGPYEVHVGEASGRTVIETVVLDARVGLAQVDGIHL